MAPTPSQLLVDYTKCTGCRICELACSAKQEGMFQPSLARLRITRYDDLGIDVPNVCGPCEEAPCVSICPVYAMRRDPITKMVYIDSDKCILCKSCVGVCVNGVIRLDTRRMMIVKCNHCEGDPECARMCPTGAITYGRTTQLTQIDRRGKVAHYLGEIRRVSTRSQRRGDG